MLLCSPIKNYGQTIYLTSDEESYVYVSTVDSSSHTEIFLIPGQFTSIKTINFLRVSPSDLEHSVSYYFKKSSLKDGDTLRLPFFKYHCVDTTYSSSGCIGTHESKNSTKTKEYNKRAIDVNKLPLSLFIRSGSGNIVLMKHELHSMFISDWDGINKKKEPCGGTETTARKEINYETDK